MIKYLRIVAAEIGLALLVFTGVPAIASAHVLKQDNGVSAVLHVPPEDNPAAGEQVDLNLSFKDKSGNFSLTNCNCQIQIQADGQTLQTLEAKPALEGATLSSKTATSFPKPGVYHVVVRGDSKDGAFKDFQLDYSLRVSADSTSKSSRPSSEIVIISIGSLIILSMVAYTSISYGGRYKKLPKGPSNNKVKGKL